jgi:hypothetical protein
MGVSRLTKLVGRICRPIAGMKLEQLKSDFMPEMMVARRLLQGG